jgi:hypothetical protein
MPKKSNGNFSPFSENEAEKKTKREDFSPLLRVERRKERRTK